MYRLARPGAANAEPWRSSTAERLARLDQALAAHRRVAVFLYEQPDTSTFRYRVYNVCQALQGSRTWRAVWFCRDELADLAPLIGRISLLVVARFRWNADLDRLLRQFRAAGTPILFDIDDLVFDSRYIPLVTNTLNVAMTSDMDNDYWFAYVGRLGMSASLADGFTTTNTYLGQLLTRSFGKPAHVIRNSLNAEQLAVSGALCRAKQGQTSRRPYTIGYFSGTPSHINDFRLISGEICQVLAENRQAELLVVGFMDFAADLQPLLKAGRIRFEPLVDFVELQRLIAQVDVNIAPLVVNTFTHCKSELKYFEAAVVRTLTLSTPTETFARCIRDGENGYLCRQGDWYPRLSALCRGETDPAPLIERAFCHTLEQYSGPVVLAEIESVYTAALAEARP
jgi:glycosyltransferase involved in cell wall biosynthesis